MFDLIFWICAFFYVLIVVLAIAFHGSVGAIFGVVAARPYWNSALTPIIFLAGAGMSMGASPVESTNLRDISLAFIIPSLIFTGLAGFLAGFQPHFAAVQARDLPHDAQAQPAASLAPADGAIHLMELVEQVRDLALRDGRFLVFKEAQHAQSQSTKGEMVSPGKPQSGKCQKAHEV